VSGLEDLQGLDKMPKKRSSLLTTRCYISYTQIIQQNYLKNGQVFILLEHLKDVS
jgi:hypothetical protein